MKFSLKSKNSTNSPSFFKKAFSLIEISIAILIIGILISGIVISDNLISKARIETAISLTKSSPVPGIKNNVLWLETSLKDSFGTSTLNDGDAIASWTDHSISANKAQIISQGSGALYSNSINRVHAVKFNGISENYLQTNRAVINNTDYTIFIIEKRQGDSNNNFFLTSNNSDFALGYSDTATIIHRHDSDLSYTSKITSYAESEDEARIFTFTQDYNDGKKTYINGILAGEDLDDNSQLNDIENLIIGKNYSGEIGEIIIYNRNLRNEERKSVENYLGKKWNRKITRDLVSNSSCIDGVVTNDGCSKNCYVTTSGISSPLTLTDGESNIEATCGIVGYDSDSEVTLSCSNGNITASGSCAADTAYILDDNGVASLAQGAAVNDDGELTQAPYGYDIDADGNIVIGYGFEELDQETYSVQLAKGFEEDNITQEIKLSYGYKDDNLDGIAEIKTGFEEDADENIIVSIGYEDNNNDGTANLIQCAVSIVGVTTSSVDYDITGNATLTCDDDNFATSTISYNCPQSGILDYSQSCACAQNYMLDSGSCVPDQCPVAINGVTQTSVPYAQTTNTLTCNGANFNNSNIIEYTCIGGVFETDSQDCECESGYSLINGACEPLCSIDDVDGITPRSLDLGSDTELTCDEANFSGTIEYICSKNDAGEAVLTTTGSCTCNDNYSNVDGTCVPQCSLSSIANYTTTQDNVSTGSGTISCNNNSYQGQINYSCNNGTLTKEIRCCKVSGGSYSSINYNNRKSVFKFTSNGTLQCVENINNARILLVGGGGGGGHRHAGGGGAGGYIEGSIDLNTQLYNIIIGSGGSGGTSQGGHAGGGGNTYIQLNGSIPTGHSMYPYANGHIHSQLHAWGGGGGGNNTGTGGGGGSGGGGSNGGHGGQPNSGYNQGYKGGKQNNGSCCSGFGAGGGGAGGPASNTGNNGSDGGPGRASDITGSTVYYAGGGGGGSFNGWRYSGGNGGGGRPGNQSNLQGSNGTNGLGGGGGGGGANGGTSGNGGRGGSGVVIISY